MFHKPKVFRSVHGCCICKAKSSSSRFTDSGKYEPAFMRCFQLNEERTGEICNACVLLVKRYVKLPSNCQRHWNHVVDARSGPGIKNLIKSKRNAAQNVSIEDGTESISVAETPEKIKRKHVYRRKKKNVLNKIKCSPDMATANNRVSVSDNVSGFVDLTMWKREYVCCGVIFRGPFGEVLIDKGLFNPCRVSSESQRHVSNLNVKTTKYKEKEKEAEADRKKVTQETNTLDNDSLDEEFGTSDSDVENQQSRLARSMQVEQTIYSNAPIENEDEGYYDKFSPASAEINSPVSLRSPAMEDNEIIDLSSSRINGDKKHVS